MLHRLPRTLVLALLASLLLVPGGSVTASARSSECAPGPATFTLGTHNTLHGRARFTPFAHVIGWQEVTDPADRAKLRRQLGPRYRHYIPRDGGAAAVPISWDRRVFAYLTSRSVKTHGGKYRVTPSRWINVVHLRHRASGRRLVVVNTHFVSEAFNPGSRQRAWRLRAWHAHQRELYETLAQIRARRSKASLVVVGDFNRNLYLPFRGLRLTPLKLTRTSHPVDHLYAGAPARGDCVQRLSLRGSDHWPRLAQIALG